MRDILLSKVRETLSQNHHIDPQTILMESSFNELGLDSLDALSLVNDLEENYGVSLPNEEVLNIKTVGQAVECLLRHVPADSID